MSVALRPFLAADGRRCAAIFRAAIQDIASEDYSPGQCEAWAARADDEAAFAHNLTTLLTLVATEAGEIVGFASLKGADHVEMIFVDPEFARQGVGAALLDALEILGRARGATKLTAEVSDTAKPLFDRQRFVSDQRIVKPIGEEWLGNTAMSKTFGPKTSGPKPREH